MNKRIPRVAAIHDLSCFGRCALTVIIPALSAMGMQTIPLPTALLSTHTGGFDNMSFLDLDSEMHNISEHFDKLEIEFDAIYTGFLGSAAQIETVAAFIDRFGSKDCIVFVDPVMGDDGMLYSTYTKELMHGMKQLCRHADVITPNFTEACFLTDTPFENTSSLTEAEVKELSYTLCGKLREQFDTNVALTGIHYAGNMIATAGLTEKGSFIHGVSHIGRNYPGTGDLFASVMLGRLLMEDSFEAATCYASDFTRETVRYSESYGFPVREGVVFEPLLGRLTQKK